MSNLNELVSKAQELALNMEYYKRIFLLYKEFLLYTDTINQTSESEIQEHLDYVNNILNQIRGSYDVLNAFSSIFTEREVSRVLSPRFLYTDSYAQFLLTYVYNVPHVLNRNGEINEIIVNSEGLITYEGNTNLHHLLILKHQGIH